MLFMGEEYGEERPFLYFVSHGDPDLLDAVGAGRREEFRSFAWRGEAPDPGAPETFRRSILDWEARGAGRHGVLRAFYKELLRLRREEPALMPSEETERRVVREGDLIALSRERNGSTVTTIFSFADGPTHVPPGLVDLPAHRLLDSADEAWGGAGVATGERIRAADDLVVPPYATLVLKGVS
jgi:maltooligosyltrehalose trehalohydrolase